MPNAGIRPLTRLLLATDFTPGSAQAIGRAALLPLGSAARVTLLHAVPPLRPALLGRERAEARQRLEYERAELLAALRRRRRTDVKVVIRVATGDPAGQIAALGRGADLVVLGRHGSRRFRDLLLGSTAERVIRRGSVPVLIVGTPARQAYRRPLAAIDLSAPSGKAVRAALRLLQPGDRSLGVIHVYEIAHSSMLRRVAAPESVAVYTRRCRAEAAAAADRLLREAGVAPGQAELLLRRGDPRATILQVAGALRADLLAVGSHGRSALADALVGVMEAVVRHASCDVLVVPGR